MLDELIIWLCFTTPVLYFIIYGINWLFILEVVKNGLFRKHVSS